MRLGVVTAGAMLAASFVTDDAEAGQHSAPVVPYCTKDATGAGYCIGSLAGFVATPNQVDWAGFYGDTTAAPYFYATLNNVNYSCTSPSLTTDPVWTSLLTQGKLLFHVFWNAQGTCTTVRSINSSLWQ